MANRQAVAAIDLGGTRFRVCLADDSGAIVRRFSRPTLAEEGPEAVILRLVEAVQEVAGPAGSAGLLGIGVGAPGPLDPWRGVILQAPNLPGWVDLPLAERLRDALGAPVYLGNDANLAALGEARFGAGRGIRDLVYITVSTGVGAGVITDGRLLLGSRGLAAELGHMVVEVSGPPCGCGNRGCLEALASGTAIANRARELLARGDESLLRRLAGDDLQIVDAALVAEAAERGDPLAVGIMRQAGAYLGIGVVNALHLFDPEVVIVGGGVSQAGELIFGPLREAVRTRAMPAYRERARIITPALGDDAGLLGAVALVIGSLGR